MSVDTGCSRSQQREREVVVTVRVYVAGCVHCIDAIEREGVEQRREASPQHSPARLHAEDAWGRQDRCAPRFEHPHDLAAERELVLDMLDNLDAAPDVKRFIGAGQLAPLADRVTVDVPAGEDAGRGIASGDGVGWSHAMSRAQVVRQLLGEKPAPRSDVEECHSWTAERLDKRKHLVVGAVVRKRYNGWGLSCHGLHWVAAVQPDVRTPDLNLSPRQMLLSFKGPEGQPGQARSPPGLR